MAENFINDEHEWLVQDRDRANKALRDFLDKEYPKGAPCTVIIMCGQKSPSLATIEYCTPGGTAGHIYVRLTNAKKRRTAVRQLSFKDVIQVIKGGDHG